MALFCVHEWMNGYRVKAVVETCEWTGWRWMGVVAMFFWFLLGSLSAAESGDGTAEERQKIATRVEALIRLQNVDLSQNAKLKAVVSQTLEKTRGTRDFVQLVRHFKLTDQTEGLLQIIREAKDVEASVEAVKWMISQGQGGELVKAVESATGPEAIRWVQMVGRSGEGKMLMEWMPWISEVKRDVGLRRELVKMVVRTQEGAWGVVKMAEGGTLPPDMAFVARTALASVRWPEVKVAAAKVLPAPAALGNEPLPPLGELLQRKGDVAKGQEWFRTKATCATCHQVAGQGVAFGPELTQIGSKLGKDALYESILDPSAGIAFGYEAWLVELKGGDEAFGLIASETEDELTLRLPGGATSSLGKKEILKRTKQPLSIMPAGLEGALTAQELVDLVEYLASLKKP